MRTQWTRESLNTNEILGGGRDWELKRRRNQYTGAINFFKDRFAGGSHTLKVGGEYLDETGETIWGQYYADNVIHFVNGSLTNGPAGTTAAAVRLANNADSWSALATTSFFVTDSWVIDRLTRNVGARFDRYRIWLPEQSLPAGRFVPVALNFEEVSEVKVFNHLAPRIGASYDLLGDGSTVLKGMVHSALCTELFDRSGRSRDVARGCPTTHSGRSPLVLPRAWHARLHPAVRAAG